MKAKVLNTASFSSSVRDTLHVGDVCEVVEVGPSLFKAPGLPGSLGRLGSHYELLDDEAVLTAGIGQANADLIADAVETLAEKPVFSPERVSDLCKEGAKLWKDKQGYPDNNPKAAVGETKCPLHLVPPALAIGVAEALKNGADKYGSYNFRESKIAASVYMGAILRHLYAWWDGEDCASDSGIDHLKHIGASIALMLDAKAAGTFDDDRPAKGGSAELLEQYNNGY